MNFRLIAFSAAVLSSAAFLAGCCSGSQCKPEFAVGAPRPELTVVRAPGEVVLDGVIDPKEWAGAVEYQMAEPAQPVRPDTPPKYAANIGKDKFEGGTVRLMYDDKYLYVGASLTDSDVMQYGDEDQTHLYLRGDTLEMFVKPENSPSYWECYGTPNGKRTSLFFETRAYPCQNEKNDLMKGMRNAVKIDGTFNRNKDIDKGWTIEVAIPIDELEKTGVAFSAREPWTILVSRYNYNYGSIQGGPRFSTLPLLPQVNYHLTEYYAKLNLK